MAIRIALYNIHEYINKNPNIHALEWREKFNDVKTICWFAGELDKNVIDNFVNLQNLNCCGNRITSLEPLINCINLQKLICSGNELTSLKPLSNCTNLRKIILLL